SFKAVRQSDDADTFRFALKATDRFRQSSTTPVFEVQATNRPNLVRFTNTSGLNPSFITPDDQPVYEVVVEDDHARGVAQQTITWSLQARTAGAAKVVLGSSTTDITGRAAWPLNALLKEGGYLLYAEADKRFNLLPATFAVNVEAGVATGVLVNYQDALEAGAQTRIELSLSDLAGNRPRMDELSDVTLRLPSGFHLALGNPGNIGVDAQGNESLSIVLGRESVSLLLSAAEIAGEYSFSVETELQVYSDPATIRDTGSSLPITVIPAAVNQVLFSFLRDDYLGNPGSVRGIEETGDHLFYALEAVDRFGNRTTDLLSYQVKEGDNVLAAGSFKGNGETKLTFADAGVHLLTLVVAHPYAFLSRPLQLDIQQRGPGLVGQQWT